MICRKIRTGRLVLLKTSLHIKLFIESIARLTASWFQNVTRETDMNFTKVFYVIFLLQFYVCFYCILISMIRVTLNLLRMSVRIKHTLSPFSQKTRSFFFSLFKGISSLNQRCAAFQSKAPLTLQKLTMTLEKKKSRGEIIHDLKSIQMTHRFLPTTFTSLLPVLHNRWLA